MYEVWHRQNIIQFCRLDLSGEAKQAAKSPHTSAPLFLSFSPVSELLFELLYCKRTEMLYELNPTVGMSLKMGKLSSMMTVLGGNADWRAKGFKPRFPLFPNYSKELTYTGNALRVIYKL